MDFNDIMPMVMTAYRNRDEIVMKILNNQQCHRKDLRQNYEVVLNPVQNKNLLFFLISGFSSPL